MHKAIVVDMDGTLALFDKASSSPYDRDFLSDIPNAPVVELVRAMKSAGFRIIILSGRSNRFERETRDWMDHNGIPFDFLAMRGQKDNRDDRILKAEMFNELVRPEHNVSFVVDDRPKVVRMWREMGLTVLHVCGWDDDF